MKLFDCFMYNNEDLLLELRLQTLSKFVHKFIIVESCFDHQGNKKKLTFKINNFLIFKNKIKYIVLNKFPKNLSSWERENYNRNFIIKGLKDAKPEDYIMISDLDEIPKISNLKIFEKRKYTAFKQKMFYYRFNLHNISEPDWIGSKVCKKKYLKSPQWLRNQKVKKYPFWRMDKINWNIIEDGGWHFSFVMSDNSIKKKIESYAHSEFNKKNYKDINNIKKNISLKKDLFGRPFKFIKIKNQKKLPKYLLLNKKKFSKFLI
jgi:beta-1,4-mannosyl-glycoprotein beta-1,4-N-acetylglucosaminyltransferase